MLNGTQKNILDAYFGNSLEDLMKLDLSIVLDIASLIKNNNSSEYHDQGLKDIIEEWSGIYNNDECHGPYRSDGHPALNLSVRNDNTADPVEAKDVRDFMERMCENLIDKVINIKIEKNEINPDNTQNIKLDERERFERERFERERFERERAEKERAEIEKAEIERAEMQRFEIERAKREKAAMEREREEVTRERAAMRREIEEETREREREIERQELEKSKRKLEWNRSLAIYACPSSNCVYSANAILIEALTNKFSKSHRDDLEQQRKNDPNKSCIMM